MIIRLSLAVFALSATAAFAQVTASISGKVEDASGSLIPAAAVTVKNLETGALRKLDHRTIGRVSRLGAARRPVRSEGRKDRLQNAACATASTWPWARRPWSNLRLDVGDLAQEVTVTEETPLVNTTTSSVSGLVGEREVKDLPLNGRSFDNLMTLNPGRHQLRP